MQALTYDSTSEIREAMALSPIAILVYMILRGWGWQRSAARASGCTGAGPLAAAGMHFASIHDPWITTALTIRNCSCSEIFRVAALPKHRRPEGFCRARPGHQILLLLAAKSRRTSKHCRPQLKEEEIAMPNRRVLWVPLRMYLFTMTSDFSFSGRDRWRLTAP